MNKVPKYKNSLNLFSFTPFNNSNTDFIIKLKYK